MNFDSQQGKGLIAVTQEKYLLFLVFDLFCRFFFSFFFLPFSPLCCSCQFYWHLRNPINLSNIHHSRILYDPPPRILEIKAKINKWDLIKIKSFCTTMEIISKVKRQTSEWEKIIANEATDKELISKIYKQLLQLNSRKINDPQKNGPKN